MARRSHEVYGWLGMSRPAHSYQDGDVDQIIAAVGELPNGNVSCRRNHPDRDELDNVELPRRVALQQMLQTAAKNYSSARKSDQEPTPKQLSEELKKIEKAATVLQDKIAVVSSPDSRLLENAHETAGLRGSVIRTLSDQAQNSAEWHCNYREKHAGGEKANRGEIDIVRNDDFASAMLGVDRIKCWAAAGYETANAEEPTPREKRHAGNHPLENFVDDLLKIYRHIFEKAPGISTGSLGGEPGGPTIRYLQACLGDETPSPHALRARIRKWSDQQ